MKNWNRFWKLPIVSTSEEEKGRSAMIARDSETLYALRYPNIFIYINFPTMITSNPVSTFGHIYYKALQVQLQKMGANLSLLRKARQEDIKSVAAAINIRPEILEKIENGEHDFRIKTLIALCDYYNVCHSLIVGKGELMNFKYE